MTARVRVFGSAQVEGQAPLGRRDRVVLAALVVSWSSALSAAGLAEALYGEEPPQTWRKVVQGSVARLRQLLGPRTIETTPDGYRLTIGDDDVDVRLFERLLRQAVELSEVGQPAGAIAPLRDALGQEGVRTRRTPCGLQGGGP
jgi:DNA-binding SARP family transcriptional activator